MSWSNIATVGALRKQYVPAYLKCLQAGKMGGDDGIRAMDGQLEDHTILLFRKMAQAKFMAAKQKAQSLAGGGNAAAAGGAAGGSAQQGWFGWMWGGGAGHKGHQQQPASSSAAGAAAGGEVGQPTLGADEWLALEKTLEEQEAALATAVKETPMTVKLRVKAVVEVAAVELQGADGTLLLQGALSGVNTAFTAYPTTTDLYLDVAMVSGTGGVRGCDG
jgi:vacuolar protein sorting-associated protein 13A/C